MAARTGLTTITVLIHHVCRTFTKYNAKDTATINQWVIDGKITAAQRDTLLAFMTSVNDVCAILRAGTGY